MKTSREKVEQICEFLYDKKSQDIIILDVSKTTILADFFVICSGRSIQQVKSLCDELEQKADIMGWSLKRKEGYTQGRWIVMDYLDVLIHIFHPEERKYYNIERLWKNETNFTDFSAQKDAQLKGQNKQ